jgi:hypothetical protein
MNMTDHCNALHEKANQMRGALWSLVFAAIAAYLVSSFGSGAPWWVYAMLFTRSVVGFAQALTDEPAMQKASDDRFGQLPISARDAAICDFEKGAFAWESSGFSAD